MRKLICHIIFLCSFLIGAAQDSLPVKPGAVVDTLRPNAFTIQGKAVTGTAAIYDADLDGTRTASGEIFFNIRLTAASNDFKLNSWVRVTNSKNKKYVLVRINDRLTPGQKKKGIAINLSLEAGKTIDIGKRKQAKVKIELITVNDSTSFIKKYIDTLVLSADTTKKLDSLTPNTFKPVGKAINGIASFYSYNLDGTLTSTGERYRNSKLTAASNNFKLNTWVLVTNLKNQKSVIVRINDHMHPRMKAKGRVVDLSREAARLLDFMDNGLTKVKVQPVKFVFSPSVKEKLDSLFQRSDSARVADSLKTDPIKNDEDALMGIASFYSFNLDGTETATGETYRNNKMSAASNDFDLNTWVRVTNLANNRSVILRINDRMHPRMQRKGRVVDLSRVAAKKLDFIKNGLTKVKVEIVPKGTME
jgi:rare lipoprotein A (peptidoglycan hydrolase)